MKTHLILNHLIACLLVLSPLSILATNQNTNLNIISVMPVNEKGESLSYFERGQYIRIDWSAYYNHSNINDRAFSGSLNLKASCQVILLDKKINYSIKFPLTGTGNNLKTVFNSSEDSDILNENSDYHEYADFYIPRELPSGKITIELTSKSSVKNIKPISFKKTIDLK
jgi:hypothetical protein